ncbi:hypothetical protein H112_03783 [Trichophyton rubrum D6]|uniref:Uncharacterized protein n=2 Tax=Trichophyton TaxID=5550 RepID=A0A022W438_TRIRU|nr:hypothetical protein H100_03792 [Trichophyton rubrum MR850]EZF42490.1 hypothetical protein H102_03780 [Trichophyton rubrum CBS 100081]EZF53102.1 hypothetical protein H103_03793 [Trichophyton rubrum CBS 288.86]EZF63775.1 hypothetical protein H104_03779 [Trichophyton rubrum CBS 289.86]EZF74470.1 hypothetical protein H105_03808 [Trichophyton soudanense CBS 452.61]EZF85050.1 hypothetical protein H110_03785 [Trichophyton rubrum MR1448]EZG06862.1 hypothetical protein H106_03604 [Trichophyton rub
MDDLMTYLPELQQALQDMYSKTDYTEMWGVDLAKGDQNLVEAIMLKFLTKASALRAFLIERTCIAIKDALFWRKMGKLYPFPFREMPELSSFVHITQCKGHHIMWIKLDEEALKRYGLLFECLRYSGSISNMASFVIDCWPSQLYPFRSGKSDSVIFKMRAALKSIQEEVQQYYPGIFSQIYIINPFRAEFYDLKIARGYLTKNYYTPGKT